ncbi:MAG: M56 family metallopeptidase, partial [Planctomycetota bacterium]
MHNYSIQIADYLLAQSWQIAFLVAAVAAATLLLKNRSAHVRYLLWLIVLAKCLVPPFLTVPLAVLPEQRAVIVLPSTEPVAVELVETSVTEAPVPSAPVVVKHTRRFTLRQWLAIGWVVGVAVFVTTAVVKALRTEFWLRRQRKLLSAKLQSEIEDLFCELGVRTLPKVWLVEGIGQPFVWGLVRGGIYLPANFVKAHNAEHRRGVIGHELSHILRFDAVVNLLQVVAQAVFWFHPFVWWANRRIRAEREKCCDEMTIARLGTKAQDYSDAIVNIVISESESTRSVPSLAVAGPVKNIEERIKTMLRPGKKFYKHPSLPVAMVVVLTALLAVPTTVVLTVRAENQPTTKSADTDRVFGNPTNLGPTVNSSAREWDPSISADGLELYFKSYRPDGYGSGDIWVTTRKTKNDPWGNAINLGPIINSSYGEGAPEISADGLALYFVSGRPGGSGAWDIWVTSRKTKEDPWGTPVNLGPTVNSSAHENQPSIS